MFASFSTHPDRPSRGPASTAPASGPFARGFKRWAEDRAVRHRLERELQSHSDRDLAELGMSRSDIPDVIRGHFRA